MSGSIPGSDRDLWSDGLQRPAADAGNRNPSGSRRRDYSGKNLVVRHGLSLTLAGVVIGIGAAWQLARLMESMLFGVQPRDPIAFFTVPAVLTAVALLAVWLPAMRASRVNPMELLRHE